VTDRDRWTEYFELEAVGHRIGLMTCKLCGATVLLGDREFDSAKKHEEWHLSIELSQVARLRRRIK